MEEGEVEDEVAEGPAVHREGTFGFVTLDANNPYYAGSWRQPNRLGARKCNNEGYTAVFHRELRKPALRVPISGIFATDIAKSGKWQFFTVDSAYEEMLRTMKVKHLANITNGEPDPIVRLFIEAPTADPAEWEKFRKILRAHDFGTPATGKPEPFTGKLWCAYCHSVDHPVGLCDLLKVEGWHDVIPGSVAIADQNGGQKKANRDADRGRQEKRGNGRDKGKGKAVNRK
ncbi:uncharacterized protein B0H18DRAFT_1126774 [Fomitopsis serialis]|uniref:uncharacterized protein n=1 Tax=Fomitopsis serialis TaxID=139415 RepID=UPI00200768EE|nr:uncharacterized protein B0H18DRAFT_1126774 [Neoantrodia serialis]KAH9912798.1 hypothetical protein B0H18DRAFT_1126774 [Neoantrodia serialis]